jgi:Secretion system C-terminal sorting domain
MNRKFTIFCKCVVLCLLATTSVNLAKATDSTGNYALNFSSAPILLTVTGTENQIGSKYRFDNVGPGRSAIVTIVSATGGATVEVLDDNNLTKPEAFSPRINVPAGSTGMVEFKIEFVAGNSTSPKKVDTLFATAMDIDGSLNLYEMDAINMHGGTVSFQSTTLQISVIQNGTEFLGKNIGGVEYPAVDTSAKQVMFTVTNNDISSFTYKAGADNRLTGAVSRQKGIYFKGFTYPVFGVLPVTLSHFWGSSRNNSNLLSWETSSELNTKIFSIEKSMDGVNYVTIGELPAAGNSSNIRSYAFTDAAVKAGISYYRLRITDHDGKFDYSAAIMLKKDQDAGQISLFPSPATDFTIVSISAAEQQNIALRMLDKDGKLVYTRNENINKGTTNIRLGQLDRYTPGTYYLQVVQAGKTITKAFMIL